MSRATLTESVATFEQRARDASLSEEWIDAFKANGLATLAKLCYAVTLPGTAPTDAQVTVFMQQLRPTVVPTLAESSAIKQLIFEAQTFMVYSLKSAVQGDEDSKKLAPAERRARLERQKTELAGASWSQARTGGLASFSVVRRWHERLFELYAQSPAPGFMQVTQAQLLRADRHAFLRMSEMFKGNLKDPVAGNK